MSRKTEQRHERDLADRKADRQVDTESEEVEMDSQTDCGHNLRVRHNEDLLKKQSTEKTSDPYHHHYTLMFIMSIQSSSVHCPFITSPLCFRNQHQG